MLFWLLCIALVLLALGVVVRPLIATDASPSEAGPSPEQAFYADQLRQLDREIERGVIEPPAAEEARAEIGRRLLREADAKTDAVSRRSRSRPLVAAFCSVAVLALSFGGYLALGSPSMEDQPLAARLNVDPRQASVPVLIARAEQRLREAPDDIAGWRALGPIYLRTGDYDAAIGAFQRVIELGGENAADLSRLAEAMMAKADGEVTADAQDALRRSVALEPSEPRANYLLAVAKAQDGDRDGAIADFAALVETLPEDSPWHAAALQAVQIASAEPAAPSGSSLEAPRPNDTQELSADPAIVSMVEGLAQRLDAQGGTVDEWQRLIRSRTVLGQREAAARTVAEALAAFPAGSEQAASIASFAEDLGLDAATSAASTTGDR